MSLLSLCHFSFFVLYAENRGFRAILGKKTPRVSSRQLGGPAWHAVFLDRVANYRQSTTGQHEGHGGKLLLRSLLRGVLALLELALTDDSANDFHFFLRFFV